MREVWIGLFEVKPRARSGHEQPSGWASEQGGAFVQALAQAEDEQDFVRRVEEELETMRFESISADDVEVFGRRRSRYALEADLIALAEEAEVTGEVCLDTFHTYPLDDL